MTNGEPTADQEPGPRDNRNIAIIALVVVLVVLIGAIGGYLLSGGLSDEPAVTTTLTPSTTVATTLPATSTTVPVTTVPQVTTTQVAASTTTSTAVSVTEGEATFAAVEDTYIDVDEPEDNSGDDEALELEHDPPSIKQGLVRFEVSGLPADVVVNEAILRFTVVMPNIAPVAVHEVLGEWSEGATTGANAPLLGDLVATIEPAEDGALFVETDVTDAIGDIGTIDFYLIVNTEGSETHFAARESGAGAPALILRWEP
jgi:hypothetical protein